MALTLMKFRIRIACRSVGEAGFAAQSTIERAVARGKARKEPSLLPRIGMTNDAVDKVRHGEPKRLLKDGDDRLKGSKHFWLTSLENHSEKQHARFQSICNLSLATTNPRAALRFALGYPLAPRWGIRPSGFVQ